MFWEKSAKADKEPTTGVDVTMNQRFTPISSVGEFGLIDALTERLSGQKSTSNLIQGIGDDAAVYRASESLFHVLTTDILIEGVHFDRSFVPMPHLGFKAISVNVSDVAAMNARPLYAVVSLGLPRNTSVEMADALYTGMAEACEMYGCTIVGGDVSTAHALTVSVSVVGEVEDRKVTFRRGANPGDYICVSGDVGGAFAGLKVLLEQRRALEEMGEHFEPDIDSYRYVIERQLRPRARTDIVEKLSAAGIRPTAMIDVSDGVASEVNHIARQSSVGATVRIAALPFDAETRFVADENMADVDTFALFGGEDYELLFTIDPSDLEAIDAMEGVSVIGTIEDKDSGVNALSPDQGLIPLHPAGFDHFAQPDDNAGPAPESGHDSDVGGDGFTSDSDG